MKRASRISALTRKSWTDLSRRPARAILTILTLALAVASFGILALPTLANRAMSSEVANARLYDLHIPIDETILSPAQLRALAKLPNISALSTRTLFITRTLIGTRWVDTDIWGVPDFTNQPVDRVISSAWPRANQVLVDVRDAMSGILAARTGENPAGPGRRRDVPTGRGSRFRPGHGLRPGHPDRRPRALRHPGDRGRPRRVQGGEPPRVPVARDEPIRRPGDGQPSARLSGQLAEADYLLRPPHHPGTRNTSRLDHAVVRSGALPAPLRIGVRNVARQKERSLTTVLQVALAVGTLLGLVSLATAVAQVTDQSWNVLDFDIWLAAQPGGHLYSASVVNDIRAQPGVSGVEAADFSDMTYQGQTLYTFGVHAETFIREPLTAGRWINAHDEATAADVAIVGSAAARRWQLHPGSRVSLTTAGGPVSFTVIGVGGSQANNGYNLYTSLPALQRLTHHPGMANALLVRATDKNHAAIDALAARLEGILARSGHPSQSQLMYAGRATDQASEHSTLVIVEGIGLLIVAISMLGLVNAITMNIIERTREIGVLRCLGARGRDLRRIFRTETITLALLGFVVAIPLGWLIAHALQWLVLHVVGPQLPAPYTLASIGVAFAGTLLLAALVVIAPLRRATRLRPGDALRYT
ncbi:MAG TPA: ABC transporter permease [Acidimicrobiales bacterium]|nr:ABC transporter permease [Acidimicrobiales bacterium]